MIKRENAAEIANAIARSRLINAPSQKFTKKRSLEGGCGVIGLISSEKLRGHCIIRPCEQMRNRGNGKGGGVAAVGLFDEYKDFYALHISYLLCKLPSQVFWSHMGIYLGRAEVRVTEELLDEPDILASLVEPIGRKAVPERMHGYPSAQNPF